MRLSIRNKLLVPSLTALVVLILCSTLLVAGMIADQLEENFTQELEVSNNILFKGVSNAAVTYKDSVRAMATTSQLRPLSNILSGGRAGIDPSEVAATVDPAEVAAATQMAQDALEGFASLYATFPVVNIAGPDGLVVAGSNKEAIGKVNIGKRAYFQASMQGETVISSPLVSMGTRDKALVISTPLLDLAGKPAGVLYAILPCATVVKNTIEGARIGKTGFAYIIDNEGLMLAHPNAKLIQEFDARKVDWGRQVLASPEGALRYTTSAGVERMLNFRLDPESGWITVTCMDISEIEEATAFIRNIALGIMLAGAALVGLIIFLVMRPIIRDLLQSVNYAKAVADGNLDSKLTVTRTDELGTLCDALRSMVDHLKEMIDAARRESENAKEQSAKAQEAMLEAEAASRQAQAKTEAMLIAADKLEQVGSVVSSASTQLSAQIEQSDRGAAESATRLAEAATAMNEMNATVQEVAKNAGSASQASAETKQKAEAGAQVVEQAVHSIEQVHQLSLELKEDMAQLNEHAQDITRIMGVISDIADQTNLLALNAAIEAARAGEAGRGFAVVADEVRKLAEKTMASTNDVGNAIKAIQESTAKSMTGMDNAVQRIGEATALAGQSGAALQAIVATVEATADQVNAIAAASEEQSAASEEINQSIVQVNDMSRQTAEAMAEASKAVSELAAQAQGLTALIQDLKAD
ncbi:methyl-accepting chemotaxis protein [Desulfovibrio sp. ZJ369]|uniref:methyl-accepting chemotaxis protein n=1 Tax=Desulfovibrio sp. ZJ369 TaxID=2709793 RepID=UPI0013EB006D|nr:methyl-accepting chemotaxis protein [Desulfovibrio sp. ZJ369]